MQNKNITKPNIIFLIVDMLKQIDPANTGKWDKMLQDNAQDNR